jgi:hypothetical protein
VAIAYELAVAILGGTFSGSGLPRFVRPLARTFFLNPVLKTGGFKRGAKAPPIFQPTASPASAGDVTARLRRAADAFVAQIEAATQQGRSFVEHPFFGRIALVDYSRLQVIHTRHHARQLTSAD